MKWLIALTLTISAMAAGIDGKWKAKFDTQVGEQNYTYEFKSDGEKLTGTAANGMGSSEIKEGSIEGDIVSFVENIDFNGNALRIEYKGNISGDEIKFVRKVGDFGTEEFVAKREK
jgi:hypothetical protein